MFNRRAIHNMEAYDKTRKAFMKLLCYAKLTGLTLFGEAILIEENTSIETMCTDGKRIYYAPAWVLSNPEENVMFDGLHEWLHIFGNHVGRRGSRDKDGWNYAADVRVAHDGSRIMKKTRPNWTLPADHIPAFPWAESLTVEQIYEEVMRQAAAPKPEPRKGKPRPDLLDEAPKGASPPDDGGPPEERDERFKSKFADNLVQAVAAIELAGQSVKELYGDETHKRIVEITRGSVPWGRLLNGRLCTELGKEALSWWPPNKRYFPELILPSLRAKKEKHLVLPIDISASITPDLINKFSAEIAPAVARAKKTTILTFDAVIREEIVVKDPRHALRDIKFLTGAHSHTSVTEVFDWVDRNDPTAIATLTDGLIILPKKRYPHAHWVIPRGGRAQPWGHNYFMELAW